MPSIISATTTNGLSTSADNSGSLQLATNNGTTAVTIDTNQRVGVGVTTISAPNGRVNTLQVGSNDSGGSAELVLGHQGDGFSLFTSGGSGVGSVSVAQGTTSLAEYTYQGIFKFNSGYGSVATAYGCRAWVNFNGQDGASIRRSGNISSVTRNSTGDYTITFSNSMPDTNYAPIIYNNANSANPPVANSFANNYTGGLGDFSTSSFRVTSYNTNWIDSSLFCVAVFR